MATFRVGVGSFTIAENKGVGFGTSPTDGLGNLQVKGVTKTTGSIVSGASSLTRYSGFAADNINQLENITLTSEVGTIGDIVVGVGTSVIISSASTVTVGTLESVSIGTHFSPPVGGIEDRGQDFVEGMMRYNTDLNTMEFYNGNNWKQFTYVLDFKNSPSSSGRGVFAGGTNPSVTSKVNSIQIPTQGNSTFFGELITASQGRATLSDGKRGISAGGYDGSGGINQMDYFTLASAGNGVDFGNLTASRWYCRGVSSSTRGVVSGGSNAQTTMDYVEIATLGNAISFGTMPQNWNEGASCQSPVRGFFLKHSTNSGVNSYTDTRTIYITIASKGAGTRWRELTTSAEQGHQAVSNNTRAVMSGGDSNDNNQVKYMEHWNMDSLGITQRFGDLTVARGYAGQGSTHTRGVFYGGASGSSPNYTNTIDFLIFATAGDAVDFGDIDVPTRGQPDGMCDSHGGLGGY